MVTEIDKLDVQVIAAILRREAARLDILAQFETDDENWRQTIHSVRSEMDQQENSLITIYNDLSAGEMEKPSDFFIRIQPSVDGYSKASCSCGEFDSVTALWETVKEQTLRHMNNTAHAKLAMDWLIGKQDDPFWGPHEKGPVTDLILGKELKDVD